VQPFWAAPNEDDLATASAKLKNAFNVERKRMLDFAPCHSDGYGLLYHALRARGDLVRQFKANSFLVRCPNEASHSSGKTGDTSTVLYLPAAGEHVGHLHCLHGHCSGLKARDWLRMFSDSEIESARVAAGLPSRRVG
jgi:hypothetical protein